MAWSWPWTRDKAPTAPAVPPATTAAPAPSPSPAPSPMGWAFLPPIQRQLAEPIRPLSRGFEPGAWVSPMFTGSMTHAVADGAPHGLIDGDGRGLGTPIQRSAAGPELTLLPPPRPRVQRSIQRATDAEVAELDAESAPSMPETWSTGDSSGAGPDGPEGEAGPDGEAGGGAGTPMTVARTAVGGAAATVPEPPRSLVRASPVGLPFVQRTAVAEPAPAPAVDHGHDHGHDHAHDHAPDHVTSDSAPSDVPASAPTLPVNSSPVPGSRAAETLGRTGTPSAMPSIPAALPIQRMSSTAPAAGRAVAGERPRLGFGPPLTEVPPTAQGMPPADRPGPALQAQRAADNGFTEVALPGVSAAPPMQSPAPGMPLQRSSTPDAAPMVAPAAPTAPAAPAESSAAEVAPVHPEDCAEPGHGHPVASPAVVAGAGPPDVVPAMETVVPELPVSPAMRGDVAPLHVGGLNTSIQRSSVLPGPGLPLQRLAVRPAGAPASPASRVVRVQRVPSVLAASPPSAGPSPTSASTPASTSASASASTPSPAMSWTTAAAGAVHPSSSPMDTSRGAASSPVPAAAGTSMAGAAPAPFLQRSTTTGAPPVSVPVAQSMGQEALLDAYSTPVAVEYAAVPLQTVGGTRAGSSAAPGRAPDAVTEPNDTGSGHGESTAGPVAFMQRSASAVASSPALRSPGPMAAPPLVMPQRASAAEVAEPDVAMVQRAEAEAPAVEAEAPPPAAEAAASTAPPAATGGAPAAGGGQSPEQAEAMARQLFPSLLRMLRGELVVDRERRGVRTDRW